jgi:hypothetical protein
MVKSFNSAGVRWRSSLVPADMNKMKTDAGEGTSEIPRGFIAELLISAECEIAAFRAAVTESYGAAQAELAVFDWIHAMEVAEWSISDGIPDWRRFTITATAKLAERVCSIRSFYSTEEIL